MEFTQQQLQQIEDYVTQIKRVEGMIGRDKAKKSCIISLKKLPLSVEQRNKILELLEYDK
jgi:hypothetical protein